MVLNLQSLEIDAITLAAVHAIRFTIAGAWLAARRRLARRRVADWCRWCRGGRG